MVAVCREIFMPAKPLTIGSRPFPRQMDAIKFFSDMLARYGVGDRVSEIDAADLRALLTRHRECASKIGAGLDHFKVDKDGYGGRCFWVVRIDASQTDFSYRRCITGIW